MPCWHFSTNRKFIINFWEESLKEYSCQAGFKLAKWFDRRRSQKTSPCRAHIFRQIKISQNILEKDHPRIHQQKLVQIGPEVLKEKKFIEFKRKKAPPCQTHLFLRSTKTAPNKRTIVHRTMAFEHNDVKNVINKLTV